MTKTEERSVMQSGLSFAVALMLVVGALNIAGASSSLSQTRSGAARESARLGDAIKSPLDPKAPATYQRVWRHGKALKSTIPASKADMAASAAVRYSDGVLIRLTAVKRGKEADMGQGTFPGRPHTAFNLKVTNNSQATIDLNQVVVTAQYGSPARIASLVYNDASAQDFTGSLKPGGSASAAYQFAIPDPEKGGMTLIVDFDAKHAPATFQKQEG